MSRQREAGCFELLCGENATTEFPGQHAPFEGSSTRGAATTDDLAIAIEGLEARFTTLLADQSAKQMKEMSEISEVTAAMRDELAMLRQELSAARRAASEHASAAASDGGEWTHGVDEASGHYYWYNERTGESVWDEPSGGGDDGECAASRSAAQPPHIDIPPPTPPKAAEMSRAAPVSATKSDWSAHDVCEAADEAEFESDVEPHVSRSPAASSAGTERLYGPSSTSTSPTSDIGDSPDDLGGVGSPVALRTELAT